MNEFIVVMESISNFNKTQSDEINGRSFFLPELKATTERTKLPQVDYNLGREEEKD